LRPEEKSSDVSLGAHLVRDAVLRRCGTAVVISNDSDFRDAIILAREAGVKVLIANPKQTKESWRLLAVASGTVRFSKLMFADARFPDEIALPSGAVLRCPDPWL
jgi:uncharacterized LabA/DUF88 family protein